MKNDLVYLFKTISTRLIVTAVVLLSVSVAFGQNTPPPESVAPVQTIPVGMVSIAGPPIAFDPLSASDAALELYGYPPRPSPTSGDAYTNWQKLVAFPATREIGTFQQTTITNGPAIVSSSAAAVNGTVVSNSYNWSGYAISAATGTFTVNNNYVFAEWTVPTAQQAFGTCDGTWWYSFEWDGFDGWGSNDVLQAGTEADAKCSGGITSAFYSSWIEWYPFVEMRVTKPVALPGDLIGVEVWYTTASPHGHAYLVNYTRLQSASYAFNPPAGTVYKGNSVEWVEERPSVNGTLANLTNYVGEAFNKNYAYGNSKYYYPSSTSTGTIYNLRMICPPWNPSTHCTATTILSTPYLYGVYALWFYNSGPSY